MARQTQCAPLPSFNYRVSQQFGRRRSGTDFAVWSGRRSFGFGRWIIRMRFWATVDRVFGLFDRVKYLLRPRRVGAGRSGILGTTG